eukprot:6461677-Amphidinium_carterae.1
MSKTRMVMLRLSEDLEKECQADEAKLDQTCSNPLWARVCGAELRLKAEMQKLLIREVAKGSCCVLSPQASFQSCRLSMEAQT